MVKFKPSTTNAFVNDFIAMRAEETDAGPEYAEAVAIALLAAVAGPRLTLDVQQEAEPITPALYLVLTGDSTYARKSQSVAVALHRLEDAGLGHLLMSEPGSPQGFLQDLMQHQRSGGIWIIDELTPLMKAMNRRGSSMSEILGYLLRAYDRTTMERRRTDKHNEDGRKHQDIDRVEKPSLTLLAAATPRELAAAFDDDGITSGFIPRFAFVARRSETGYKPLGRRTTRSTGLRKEFVAELQKLDARLGHGVEARLTKQAWKASEELDIALMKRAEGDLRRHLSPIYIRCEVRILKVALTLAYADSIDGKPDAAITIKEQHVREAGALVDRWLADSLDFASLIGATKYSRDIDAVFASIQRKPGLSRIALMRAHRNLRANELDEITDRLESERRIEIKRTETKGRSRRNYVPL